MLFNDFRIGRRREKEQVIINGPVAVPGTINSDISEKQCVKSSEFARQSYIVYRSMGDKVKLTMPTL